MTISEPLDFQRARRPEQREARRRAILDVAAQLLGEMPVSDISLRELARGSVCRKRMWSATSRPGRRSSSSCSTRPFDEWLDELPAELPPPTPADPAVTRRRGRRAGPVAVPPPLIVRALERARDRTRTQHLHRGRPRPSSSPTRNCRASWRSCCRERVPALTEPASRELVSLTVVLIGRALAVRQPLPVRRGGCAGPLLAHARFDFADRLSRALLVTVTGLLAVRSDTSPAS